jgi:hypothetical protein
MQVTRTSAILSPSAKILARECSQECRPFTASVVLIIYSVLHAKPDASCLWRGVRRTRAFGTSESKSFKAPATQVWSYGVPLASKQWIRIALLVAGLAPHLHAQPHADRIIVHKQARTMELTRSGQVLKTYKIALGGEPVGPKTRQGDHRTPEGLYVIDSRNAHSQFHRSLHISYPNTADKERARKLGVASGGDIYIHGLPNGYGFIGAAHRAHDWTDGCIAVTDQEIEEIWRLVDNGTPVEIHP